VTKLNGVTGSCIRALGVAGMVIVSACSGNPAQPTASAPSPVAVTPPTVNAPPVIRSLSVGPRVEADDDVSVTADVADADTPLDQLTYEWSVAPAHGVFVGSGRQVVWKAPRGEPTPDVYVFSLTVTDRYMSGGAQRESKASSSLPVHYNDSHGETAGLGLAFLRDFANYSVSPEQVVRNFSDSCPGKLAELQVIQNNRRDYQILGGDFSVALTGLYDNRTVGEIIAPCTFRNLSKATGKTETTSGTCTLTTVYENWKWQLCASRFSTSTAAMRLSRP
jgi:hypothetical protein